MKVFVSSTSRDLGNARKSVCERLPQIEKAYECMDCYTSDPRSPKQLDDAKVKSCDAFVIIVGHLYGSCPPDNEKSFTELEYEAALQSGIDVYAFLASDQFPLSPSLRENDTTYEKLQAFRDRLAQHHAPRYFDNEDQLCTEVIACFSSPQNQNLDVWSVVTSRLQECLDKSQFLSMPCLDADVTEFDEDMCQEICSRMLAIDKTAAADGLPQLLRESKLISPVDGRSPTYAAVLMFHRQPDLLMPDACVVCHTLGQGEARKVVRGPLPAQINESLAFLQANLRDIIKRTGASRRESTLEIPPRALRELVVNALIHRNYQCQEHVTIHIRKESVEIRNPGQLAFDLLSLPREDLWHGRRSRPVNPILAAIADFGELVERSGTGFELVREEFAEAGLALPTIDVDRNSTVVTIARPRGVALARSAPESQLSVPLAPAPYLAHAYPLQENFTGRLKERAMLTEWVCAQDSRHMLSLIGMGGLGKSALTWYWLTEDLPQENIQFSGIMWWSFYEQEAGFEAFLSHALAYASHGTIDPQKVPSDYDRMQYLWCLLKESPFLLILDGAERLLRAYHGLDAPYKGDDFTKQEHDRHLCCADPRAGTFLQSLAISGTRTRTLLTTRLQPRELHDLAGCRKENLQRLDPDDAVTFMRRQGIKGPRTAIIHACQPYDFLPLCLRLLSGAIREDPQMPNDIAAADSWRPPDKLVRKEHHILEIAYDTMPADRRDLLSRIAAMRGPVDYDTAKALSTYDAEGDLKDALCELVARGLLFQQEARTRYHCHPVVRNYAYDRLSDKTAAHETLKDYFDTIPEPNKIETIDDLLPAIELFHHTIRSGGYEEAFRVYIERLTDPLYFQLGAYDTFISVSQSFFPDGEDKPPRLEAESDQGWVLNSLAITYSATGQDRKAVVLKQQAVDRAARQGRKGNVAISLGNLALSQILLGELKQAESNLRREIEIAREIGEEFDEAGGRNELGLLLAYMSQYNASDEDLAKALATFAALGHKQGQCLVWSYRAIRALLMDEPESAIEVLGNAREVWQFDAEHDSPAERDLVVSLWLSGAAKRGAGILIGAEVNLSDALSRCRRIRLVESEADILLEMARLHWQKAAGKDTGLIAQARALTAEALDIADRCEYRLKQADIHNFLAQMALAENDKVATRKHAKLAHDYAYCDGPPHSYQKALDTANQTLAKLNNHNK